MIDMCIGRGSADGGIAWGQDLGTTPAIFFQ